MIAAQGLRVVLGGRAVIDGVTLKFAPGWTAVVGPNGAGKSTLLRALAGLLPAARGEVRVGGRSLSSLAARERGRTIAWLAQQSEAGGDLGAHDVVRLGRLPHTGLLGTPGADDEAAVAAAMAETECGTFASRRLSALSGGERQRVLLARALAVQAPVLLLDEPTTHLDAPHQRTLLAGMRRRAAAGTTVVSVLHELTTALAADRVIVMHAGRVVADGRPGDGELQRALVEVFAGAFSIERLADPAGGGERWVALPRL